MLEKYVVSSSPHISSSRTTRNIMGDVLLALVPAVIAAVLLYGFYPLFVILLSVGSAVLGETLYNKIRKFPNTVKDLSAVVTGVIFALSIPPVVPVYVPVIGGLFATVLVKMLFGGLGKNFANPAVTARIFVVLAWGTALNTFVPVIDLSNGFSEMFKYFGMNSTELSAIASATPLGVIKDGLKTGTSLDVLLQSLSNSDMFLGTIAGCAGEVSALALIIGGVYLLVRKVIRFEIPVLFVATTVFGAVIFYGDFDMALPTLLSGGLLFGAIFMATDYTTNPNTTIGRIIFAVGCGLLTIIFRKLGRMAEGVSFAILLMNIVTPLLDKWIKPKPFGYQKPVKPVKAEEVKK